jgi:HK97 gp10 family phage protein
MFRMRHEGGEALAQALNALPPRVSRRALLDALVEAGEPMRQTMGRLAPREPGAPDIADSMVISELRTKLGSFEGEDLRRDEFQQAVAVGPSKGFFYGYFQEYGTSRHAAQSFARPAFDSDAPKAVPVLAAALWRLLAARGIQKPMATRLGPVTSVGGRTL